MKKRSHPLFTKSELIYLFLSVLVGISVVVLINNDTINPFLSALNPILQFLVINLGIYLCLFFVIKSVALRTKKVWLGVFGAILWWIAGDMLMPEYHVTNAGLVAGGVFGQGAPDYVFGYLYMLTGLPLTQIQFFGYSLLSILVYVVTFMMLVIVGAVIEKNFVKSIS